jgi:hypothetical protein
MVVCRDCNVLLTDDNWAPSFKKNDNQTCKYCYNKRHNAKNSPKNNPKSNPNRLFINGEYISRKDPRYKLFKPGNYKNISDAIFEQSAASTIKEGHVYAITNKAWPDWVKIGMAIDAEDRLNGYQTSSPHRDYVLEHSVFSNDRRKAEQEAHTKALKIALDSNSEWFKLSVEQAINILDNLNEHGSGTTEEANTVTPKDELQERPIQGDLWSYAEDREAGRVP